MMSETGEHRGGEHIAVKAVEQPAMAGQQRAGILHARLALDFGLAQIARLREQRKTGC